MNYSLKVEDDLALLSCETEFTGKDALAALTEFSLAPWCQSIRKFLIVDSGSKLEFSKDEVRRISDKLRSLLVNPELRIALVVARTLHYGMGRMLEVTTGTRDRRFRVFMMEEEAREWLGTESGSESI